MDERICNKAPNINEYRLHSLNTYSCNNWQENTLLSEMYIAFYMQGSVGKCKHGCMKMYSLDLFKD